MRRIAERLGARVWTFKISTALSAVAATVSAGRSRTTARPTLPANQKNPHSTELIELSWSGPEIPPSRPYRPSPFRKRKDDPLRRRDFPEFLSSISYLLVPVLSSFVNYFVNLYRYRCEKMCSTRFCAFVAAQSPSGIQYLSLFANPIYLISWKI